MRRQIPRPSIVEIGLRLRMWCVDGDIDCLIDGAIAYLGLKPSCSSGPKTDEMTDAVSNSNGESIDLCRPNMPSRRRRALPLMSVPLPSEDK